jgi:hypothetical protein
VELLSDVSKLVSFEFYTLTIEVGVLKGNITPRTITPVYPYFMEIF